MYVFKLIIHSCYNYMHPSVVTWYFQCKQMCHHFHSLKELEKEITTLETGLKELKDEVSYHHDNPSYEPDNRFLVVMEPSLQEAIQSFDKMQETKIEMKEKVTNNKLFY